MATWYYAGVDKTGHKCPYCCDAFESGVGGCGLICAVSADPAWTCVPPPFGDECFVYRKNFTSPPFSVSVVWNSWYFGATQTLSCYPSSTTPPCVNSAGWSVVGSLGGGCSGVAYSGVGGCGSGVGCTGCSQTIASIRLACTGPAPEACPDDPYDCFTYTGIDTWLPYCRGCSTCSYSTGTQCEASCDSNEEGCAGFCDVDCIDNTYCPPFYECVAGACVPAECHPVTGASVCDPCHTLGCTEDEGGDIGVCYVDSSPTCDANHYLYCTCFGWECLCNSDHAACCTESNPYGDTEPGQTGWRNVSHGRCRPCYWPAPAPTGDCCSRSGGTYEQKHCSSLDEGCCPDGRCYPSASVICRYDITNGYTAPCGDATEVLYP